MVRILYGTNSPDMVGSTEIVEAPFNYYSQQMTVLLWHPSYEKRIPP